MKKINFKGKKFILSLVFIFVICSTSLAFAWFSGSATIVNQFHAGTVCFNFTECFTSPKNWNPGDCTPKVLHINNTGTKAVYTRIKLCPSWNCNLPVSNVCYAPNNCDWVQIGDYYYYKKILGSNMEMIHNNTCVTLPLLIKFSLLSGNQYEGKTFTLAVTADVVQAKNGAVQQAWNLTPAEMNLIGFQQYQ
jgi:hypothetical protein